MNAPRITAATGTLVGIHWAKSMFANKLADVKLDDLKCNTYWIVNTS